VPVQRRWLAGWTEDGRSGGSRWRWRGRGADGPRCGASVGESACHHRHSAHTPDAASPMHTHTHTHRFNGPLSRTIQDSWYQKGRTNLDFTRARDSEWQWHLLGHMQVCTSLQTDNRASTPPLSFYRLDAFPAAHPTVSKHCLDINNK